jgi:hypothetical protein
MRRVLAALVAAAVLIAPVQAQQPPDPRAALEGIILGTPAPSQPDIAEDSAEGTILGMSYTQAALIGRALWPGRC